MFTTENKTAAQKGVGRDKEDAFGGKSSQNRQIPADHNRIKREIEKLGMGEMGP